MRPLRPKAKEIEAETELPGRTPQPETEAGRVSGRKMAAELTEKGQKDRLATDRKDPARDPELGKDRDRKTAAGRMGEDPKDRLVTDRKDPARDPELGKDRDQKTAAKRMGKDSKDTLAMDRAENPADRKDPLKDLETCRCARSGTPSITRKVKLDITVCLNVTQC
jgi:hypothetical protein